MNPTSSIDAQLVRLNAVRTFSATKKAVTHFLRCPIFFSIAILCVAPLSAAVCEEGSRPRQVNPARDERLPPVLPGEVVKEADGSEMKVWSSAGPIPSGHVPAPPVVSGSTNGAVVVPGLGNVIVDTRGLNPTNGNEVPNKGSQ